MIHRDGSSQLRPQTSTARIVKAFARAAAINADDMDEIAEAGEVVWISRIERKAVLPTKTVR